jgi:hypothetical protein
MAFNIDYSGLTNPGTMAGFQDPMLEGMRMLASQLQAKKKQERELTFLREREAGVNARADRSAAEVTRRNDRLDRTNDETIRRNRALEDETHRRTLADETVKLSDRKRAADDRIRAAAGIPGNLDEARRQAGAFSAVDPETNQVIHGRPFHVEQSPPPPRPTGLVEGPSTSPEDLDRAAKIRAEEASFEPAADQRPDSTVDTERASLAQSDEPFQDRDSKMALYQRQFAASRDEAQNPKVSIGGVETTPRDIRYAGARANAEDFKRTGEALANELSAAQQMGDPVLLASVQRKMQRYAEALPQVESGALDLGKASALVNSQTTAENTRGATQEHDRTAGTFAQTRAETTAAASAARAAANSPAAKHGGMDPQVENVTLRRRDAFEKRVKDMATRHDLPADTKNFQRAAMNIDSAETDNSVLQAAAQFGVARDITGGGGQSLSNKDVAMVAPRAGGMERLAGLAGRFVNGDQLSDAEKHVLADAIRHGMDFAKTRFDAFEADYNNTFMSPDLPWVSELGDKYIRGTLRAYVPGSAGTAGARGGGARVDPNNPDDANARDAGRPLDGDAPDPSTMTREEKIRRLRAMGVR